MLQDSRIVFLDIYVSNLKVSRRYYEEALGLRVVDEGPDSVKFDTGLVILALKRAHDHGIQLPAVRDGSADIVFLVDDLNTTRAALEQRGVELNPTFWYEPGGLVDFYDPDLHWLTLYQPSEKAMSWLSADRIRAVIRARQRGVVQAPPKASATDDKDLANVRLDGAEVIYLFRFVEDPVETEAFYHKKLGLRSLEGGPCSQTCEGDSIGVVKYDTGGIMLSTHFIDEKRTMEQVLEHSCPPRELDLNRMKGVAVTFHVTGIEQVMAGLSQRGVRFANGPIHSKRGAVVAFEDPTGHLCYLYEPSMELLSQPVGAKIRQILATPL